MKVNLNVPRESLAYGYIKLIEIIKKNKNLIDINNENLINAVDLIRYGISSLLCCYDDEDPLFADLSDLSDELPWLNEDLEI